MSCAATLGSVHWDHLFEDLEGQLAAEWESERAALDAESERLRIARIELIERLRQLAAHRAGLRVELRGGEAISGEAGEVGADWFALRGTSRLTIVPLSAVSALGADLGALLESLASAETGGVRSRMTLGFVLRDLARRRVPVRLGVGGRILHGTVDRAGADHLDLALHERDEPRRADAVRGFRIIPLDAVEWVAVERGAYDAAPL